MFILETIRMVYIFGPLSFCGSELCKRLNNDLVLFQFGYYSVYCTNDSSKVVENKVVGPLIRTKGATENEGGVAVGISAIDSPFFIENSGSSSIP